MSTKWPYLTNNSDETLVRWSRLSPLKKLQWLENMRQFYRRLVPKKKRILYRDYLRDHLK